MPSRLFSSLIRESHCLNFGPYHVFQIRLNSWDRTRRYGYPVVLKIAGLAQHWFCRIPESSKKDFKFMKLIVNTSNDSFEQRGSPSMPLRHSTLFELLQKEIRPGKSIFEFGDSVISKAWTGIPNATQIKFSAWPPTMDSDQTDEYCSVRYNVAAPIGETNWAWIFSSRWTFNTTINSDPITLKVRVLTVMTRTADVRMAGGSGSETSSPQVSETTVSQPTAEDAMRKLHRTLIDRLKGTRINYSHAQASRLAKVAYQLSDESSEGSHLATISVHIHMFRPGHDLSFHHLNYRLTRSEYETSRKTTAEKLDTSHEHVVYLALGSNIGDRIAMLDLACHELDRRGIRVVRTSSLYETEPMYLQNQPAFVNGVCEVRTTLKPLDLLDRLKEIETALGRQKTVENGPRSIDLDILLYDDEHVDHEHLVIPHKRMMEREFVLRPLCDLIPEATLPPPLISASFATHLLKLPISKLPLSPLTPLSPKVAPILSLPFTRNTRIMAILNLTPDSFSDGNLHSSDPDSLLVTLEKFLLAGVSILDVGGQSTRPNAPQITAEEEISRVLPTIKFVRSQSAFDKMAISIDTYRASVADAAISAGANIVNDVSAGRMDSGMLPKIAELNCSVILMHMRGTPITMTTQTDYPSGVVQGVGSELLERVTEAEQAGIRRWRMMLDPGIGFAKNDTQNLELLQKFASLRNYRGLRGLPWVVGSSRKGFIGRITGVETPENRSWGTAATVTAAIQGGANIVRVHDVPQMAQVAKMADAIWRA